MPLYEGLRTEEQISIYVLQQAFPYCPAPLWCRQQRLELQEILANPDHTKVLNLAFGISIRLCETIASISFTDIYLFESIFCLVLKLKHITIILLLGVNSYVIEAGNAIFPDTLISISESIIEVTKGQPSKGINRCEDSKGMIYYFVRQILQQYDYGFHR